MGNTLALDCSTKSTGWATKVDGVLQYGCITSSSVDVEKRITIMRDSIIRIVEDYNIDKIIVEEVRPDGANAHTGKVLTWLQGCIVIAVYEKNKNIKFEFVGPSSWRSKIGIQQGRGVQRATLKARDIAYVKNKYGIDVNDDIADAIGIYDAYAPVTIAGGFEFA